MKTKKKKLLTAIVAGATALALTLGSTFAWQSISQRALNEAADTALNPGGRLHDDFHFPSGNKDVYVENFADENIFARVRLDEYFEIVLNKGTSGELTDIITEGADKADKTTWLTHLFGEDATNSTDPWWKWTTGGSTVFMPTFNKNKDSLVADINGTYNGPDGTVTEWDDDDRYSDYYRYTLNEEKTADAIYDYDSNDVDEVGTDLDNYVGYPDNVRGVSEKHTAKSTRSAKLISMAEWAEYSEEDQVGDYWVYDEDGWVYWAAPIAPGEATGLLLDGIALRQTMDDSWYYGINVVGQFITADHLGKTTGTGFYADGTAPSDSALDLLDKIGVDVSGEEQAPQTLYLELNYDETATVYANPGDSIILSVNADDEETYGHQSDLSNITVYDPETGEELEAYTYDPDTRTLVITNDSVSEVKVYDGSGQYAGNVIFGTDDSGDDDWDDGPSFGIGLTSGFASRFNEVSENLEIWITPEEVNTFVADGLQFELQDYEMGDGVHVGAAEAEWSLESNDPFTATEDESGYYNVRVNKSAYEILPGNEFFFVLEATHATYNGEAGQNVRVIIGEKPVMFIDDTTAYIAEENSYWVDFDSETYPGATISVPSVTVKDGAALSSFSVDEYDIYIDLTDVGESVNVGDILSLEVVLTDAERNVVGRITHELTVSERIHLNGQAVGYVTEGHTYDLTVGNGTEKNWAFAVDVDESIAKVVVDENGSHLQVGTGEAVGEEFILTATLGEKVLTVNLKVEADDGGEDEVPWNEIVLNCDLDGDTVSGDEMIGFTATVYDEYSDPIATTEEVTFTVTETTANGDVAESGENPSAMHGNYLIVADDLSARGVAEITVTATYADYEATKTFTFESQESPLTTKLTVNGNLYGNGSSQKVYQLFPHAPADDKFEFSAQLNGEPATGVQWYLVEDEGYYTVQDDDNYFYACAGDWWANRTDWVNIPEGTQIARINKATGEFELLITNEQHPQSSGFTIGVSCGDYTNEVSLALYQRIVEFQLREAGNESHSDTIYTKGQENTIGIAPYILVKGVLTENVPETMVYDWKVYVDVTDFVTTESQELDEDLYSLTFAGNGVWNLTLDASVDAEDLCVQAFYNYGTPTPRAENGVFSATLRIREKGSVAKDKVETLIVTDEYGYEASTYIPGTWCKIKLAVEALNVDGETVEGYHRYTWYVYDGNNATLDNVKIIGNGTTAELQIRGATAGEIQVVVYHNTDEGTGYGFDVQDTYVLTAVTPAE